jgi:NAD(P)H-hydrate epimerase
MIENLYLSRAQVREIDRRATAEYGIPSIVLMENAGRGCAELMMRLNPEKTPVLIFCGPGNNGGDGYVIARHLDNHGWPVFILQNEGVGPSASDAAINCTIAEKMKLMESDREPDKFGWCIDSLFGTGLTRPIADKLASFLNKVKQHNLPILSVDLPSGLDCDIGEPLGACVKAMHTATFVAPKLGFKNPKSKQYTGEVHVIDIGVPRKLVEEYV